MATARKSDLGHEEERTLWLLNKAGDLSHYDEGRGFIWLCLQVTSHGDEGRERGGAGSCLPRRRDVGAAQTEKLHAVIEMGSPLNSNFCPAWKPAIIESLPLSHRLMPFMLAFSYTVAFLCKRIYMV